ncbi:hypothetical protein ACFV4N_18990, partial [Actinosynnema sp. NPDC059797]
MSGPGVVGIALFLTAGWHSSWPHAEGLSQGAVAAMSSFGLAPLVAGAFVAAAVRFPPAPLAGAGGSGALRTAP